LVFSAAQRRERGADGGAKGGVRSFRGGSARDDDEVVPRRAGEPADLDTKRFAYAPARAISRDRATE